jgi:hypothetical protein
VRYEAWQDAEGVVFLPDDEKKERQLAIALVGKREFVWSVEADSWDEAMTAWHEHQGWQPYVPMEDQTEPPDQSP